MRKSRYSASQIVGVLKEAAAGVALEDLIRQHGFSRGSFYEWKAKYSGMSVADLKRLNGQPTKLSFGIEVELCISEEGTVVEDPDAAD